MKLTFEQMKTCSVGALRVWEENGRFRFARMSEQLERAFENESKAFYYRARSTTECRLDFHTDSRNLRVDVDVETIESNVNGKYEIFIDGLPARFVKAPGPQKICMELPEGDKYISVLLPCHNVAWFTAVFLDDGSYVRPHQFDRKMLFLGDSITQGYNATHEAQSYSYTVARHFNAWSMNWAVGGANFDETTVEKTEFDPDIVFVAYGTNDYAKFTSVQEYHDQCTAYLDKVKALYGDKQVFVISPIWRPDGNLRRATGTLRECCALIAREAEARGFTPIEGFKLFPHVEEYFADGYLHPNDLGFAHYARSLIKVLTPLI